MRFIQYVVLAVLLLAACTPAAPVEEVQDVNQVENEVQATPVAGSSWCNEGAEYNSNDGESSSVIEGMVSFRGQEYCKATGEREVTTEAGVTRSTFEIYFTQDGQDLWTISTTHGPNTPKPIIVEVHTVNGKIVSSELK